MAVDEAPGLWGSRESHPRGRSGNKKLEGRRESGRSPCPTPLNASSAAKHVPIPPENSADRTLMPALSFKEELKLYLQKGDAKSKSDSATDEAREDQGEKKVLENQIN